MSDLIRRKAAIEVIEDELDKIDHVPQWVFDKLTNRLRELPSAHEWDEMLVICDNCGHAIHVKRLQGENDGT